MKLSVLLGLNNSKNKLRSTFTCLAEAGKSISVANVDQQVTMSADIL